MTRRELIKLTAALSVSPRLHADTLPGFYYRDYSRCLPDHLTSLSSAAYTKRNRELAALTTPAAIGKRQQWVTQTLWNLIGGQSERTPLNPRVTGKFDRESYRLEKVVYESRPQVFVTANLYIPTSGAPPYPGVLFQLGHSLIGKAYASYQKCCQGLARLGFLVLAFDPMGQGERIYYLNSSGHGTRRASADDEHTHPGKQFLLLGNSSTQFQLWDAIRSLDYLASHPMVDPQRLASTGQSGGATLTMLLAAVDPRLKAAVVCSGNTENVAIPDFVPPGSTDDAEQDFLYSGPLGFDRWDLLYPIAPRPLLIQVSAHDFYGTYSPRYLTNGRDEYQKLAKIYTILGHRDHLDWRDTPLPHGLTYSFRLQTYNWLERHLKNSNHSTEKEPPVAPESQEALWVGPTGNAIRDFQSRRPFDLIREAASKANQDGRLPPVKTPPRDTRFSNLREVPGSGATFAAVEVRSAPDVWIPAWFVNPTAPGASRHALLILDDQGRNRNSAEDGLVHQLARAGASVCAADLRGIGDTRPEVGRGQARYEIAHDAEEDYAWGGLILGESLLSQRSADILALAQALKNDSRTANRRLIVAARGCLTVPALFAFAASPLIDSLYLAGPLVSYRNLLETEEYRQPLSNLDWNLFRHTDLPQLTAKAAPRTVYLAGAVDARGEKMDVAAVNRIYASDNVRISPEPAWDEQALSAL